MVVFLLWDDYRPRPAAPSSPPHEILVNRSQLNLLASFQVCVAGAVNDNALLALDHRLVYLYSDGTPFGPRLRLQDLYEASPTWESGETPHPFSMAASDDTLFLSSSLEVRAYSLANGELLWQNMVLPGHTGNVIAQATGQGVTVYYTQDNPVTREATVLTLDPASGDVITKTSYPCQECARMAPLLSNGVLWIGTEHIWRSSSPTDDALWRIDSRPRIALWPVEYEHLIIFSSGFFPSIYAIDAATGSTAWQDDREFASLPVVFRGLLYSITRDSTLSELDPSTGSQLGFIQFSPLEPDIGSRSNLYALASSDEILAAYFGDSCQILVFN